MENFVVSARKYRPSTFKTVVGQDSITTTLKNAIKNNHLAQAFLFCGPRGVGKTTCARILAKTINCTNLNSETESCNTCESCMSFNQGQSLNIYELDAASNNSVDDIRNLVEQVRYPPHSGQYKIYIIDEVHMLSTSAFNAFLKTLEEPPPYAIFILATTEKHKIIPTILSRCQIFDFNRISVDDIAGHLMWIGEQEKIAAEQEALHMIAQKADGALRDALSIFDQIVSFSGDSITYQHVIENLNILDYDYYFRVTDYILLGDYPNCLLIVDQISSDGFDLHHFINGLSTHFRDLLVSKDPKTIELLEVGPGIREKYAKQSRSLEAGMIFTLLEISNKCDIQYKLSLNKRLLVEIALLQMCNISNGLAVNKQDDLTSGQEKPIQKKTPEKKPEEVNIKPSGNPSPVQKKTEKNTEKVDPLPVIKTSQNSNNPSTGILSIHDRLNKTKANLDELEVTEKKNSKRDPFSPEQLNKAWFDFHENSKAQGKIQLATTLTMSQPELIKTEQIQFSVSNTVQEAELLENLDELTNYLRTKLSNNYIAITIQVEEVEESERKPYTNSEKFKKMAEKNPVMNDLKKQFDLDLD